MTNFEKKSPAKQRTETGSQSGANPAWRRIRENSVLEFVDRVAGLFGAPKDKALRAALQRMALQNGTQFNWRGTAVTEAMALDAWKRSFHAERENEQQPFTAAQWREFNAAMAKVRDPSIAMIGKADLLKIGESIEVRQMAMRGNDA